MFKFSLLALIHRAITVFHVSRRLHFNTEATADQFLADTIQPPIYSSCPFSTISKPVANVGTCPESFPMTISLRTSSELESPESQLKRLCKKWGPPNSATGSQLDKLRTQMSVG